MTGVSGVFAAVFGRSGPVGEVSWWTGRIVAYTHDPVTVDDPGVLAPHVFNVLLGQASQLRSTPFGDVGTVFSGQGIEMVWVSKLAEPIDENWFSSAEGRIRPGSTPALSARPPLTAGALGLTRRHRASGRPDLKRAGGPYLHGRRTTRA
jgi:hypothetical protein